jgi:hypothetical protein
VTASRYSDGEAYVALDGHRSNDFNVYLFRASEYGETWQRISNGIPESAGTVHVIREHHRNRNLLFAGLEFGAYVTFDHGANWHALKGNFPPVPVDDIAIHPRDNDLILATHGRSFWILDDINPLEHLDDKVAALDLHVFDIRPATAWRMYGGRGVTGHQRFIGANPLYGAMIQYYLKAAISEKEKVKITVLDKSGKTVRELDGPKEAGLNRVNWDLRYAAPAEPTEEQRNAMTQGFFFGGARGPMVEPGEYAIKIAAGKTEATQTAKVEEDPRINASAAERAARHKALMDLYELYKTADSGQKSVTRLKTQLTSTLESWKRPGASAVPENVRKSAEALSKQVDDLSSRFVAPQGPTGAAGPPLEYRPPTFPQRIGRLMFAIEGYTAAPTSQQIDDIAVVSKSLPEAMTRLKKLTDEDLPALNKAMNDAGMPHIALSDAPAPAAPVRRRR